MEKLIPSDEMVRQWLAAKVDRERYEHSLRVMELIPKLARAHGVAGDLLRMAALLHDAARGMTDAEMLAAARRWSLEVRSVDRDCPVLLHGRLAVVMAGQELGLHEPAVVSAILFHTSGDPEMSLPDKLFFLADMIEPARRMPGVKELRALSYTDANAAMLLAIEINKKHLAAKGRQVDPVTLELERVLKIAAGI